MRTLVALGPSFQATILTIRNLDTAHGRLTSNPGPVKMITALASSWTPWPEPETGRSDCCWTGSSSVGVPGVGSAPGQLEGHHFAVIPHQEQVVHQDRMIPGLPFDRWYLGDLRESFGARFHQHQLTVF